MQWFEGKTLKREVAIFLVGFLCWTAYRSATAEIEANGVNQAMKTLEILITPFMLYIGAAFGMDWMKKQTGLVK